MTAILDALTTYLIASAVTCGLIVAGGVWHGYVAPLLAGTRGRR